VIFWSLSLSLSHFNLNHIVIVCSQIISLSHARFLQIFLFSISSTISNSPAAHLFLYLLFLLLSLLVLLHLLLLFLLLLLLLLLRRRRRRRRCPLPVVYVLRHPCLLPSARSSHLPVPLSSLSLPLKSTSVSSSRDFTCSCVHYGRLQASRMQAIKCVVVGDGYVIHKIIIKFMSIKLKFKCRNHDLQRDRKDSLLGLVELDRERAVTLRRSPSHTSAQSPRYFSEMQTLCFTTSPPRPCGPAKQR